MDGNVLEEVIQCEHPGVISRSFVSRADDLICPQSKLTSFIVQDVSNDLVSS